MHGHSYTEEEREFMAVYVPGHSYREIKAAFTEEFGWDITIAQVKSYIGNNHLNTGRTGRFGKGHVPPNKGKKGYCAAGCEKTWFQKGHVPKGHRPVGSERVNVDGYVEVKTDEPNRWKLKHRVVWESVYGEIPEGHIVIFKDNDKSNMDISNLLLITRRVHAVLNHTKLCRYTEEFKETAVNIAELKCVCHKAKERVGN